MCDTTRSRRIVKDASDLEEVPCSNLVGLAEVDFNPVRRKSYAFCRRTERGKRSFIVLLKKEWSQVRDLTREEREAFRAERERADAALRVERREVAAAQERLRAETENLRASIEQLQRRVEGQSGFARGEPFAGLGSVGGLEGRLPARQAAGSGFVPAGFQSPRLSVSGGSGTASAPRIGENTVSSNVTKQIKDVPFFHGAKAEFPKFKRDLITLAISGPVWSSSSGELKGSQVLPEANLLLVWGLLEGSRDDYQLGELLEAVSYQRGFSLRDRP